jgi:uncharacterized membrane protein
MVSRLVSIIRAMRMSRGIAAAIPRIPALIMCHFPPE